jgi:hypothetical protein
LDIHGPSEASAEAAVATAVHDRLVPAFKQLVPVFDQLLAIQDCIKASVASIKDDYAAALDRIPAGAPKRQGRVLGGKKGYIT